ncbi:MAG: hypothetical protein R2865_06915 [Deinococcales bacterium]
MVALREQTQSTELVVEAYVMVKISSFTVQTLDYIVIGSKDLTVDIMVEDKDKADEKDEEQEDKKDEEPKEEREAEPNLDPWQMF